MLVSTNVAFTFDVFFGRFGTAKNKKLAQLSWQSSSGFPKSQGYNLVSEITP